MRATTWRPYLSKHSVDSAYKTHYFTCLETVLFIDIFVKSNKLF